MTKLLIISSQVHKTLSSLQLEKCLSLVQASEHDYQVVELAAGTYEIPFVINSYHQHQPYDGYLALGLILEKNKAHYDFIMSHISRSFTHFALNHIPVGNGIISAKTIDDLSVKIESQDPCLSAYPSAFRAVDALIRLQKNFKASNPRPRFSSG